MLAILPPPTPAALRCVVVTTLASLPTADLVAYRDRVQRRYDAFTTRGLALDLTRGKPSSDQLDLSNGLLTLPGASDFLAADATDVRNYGGLQGLPELRALLAPIFGVPPTQVVLGDNSSLALMHDALAFAMLKGTIDSPRPWVQEPRLAFLCPVPGYDRHFAITDALGFDLIPVPLSDAIIVGGHSVALQVPARRLPQWVSSTDHVAMASPVGLASASDSRGTKRG